VEAPVAARASAKVVATVLASDAHHARGNRNSLGFSLGCTFSSLRLAGLSDAGARGRTFADGAERRLRAVAGPHACRSLRSDDACVSRALAGFNY
jgi:hypothetical protein